MSICGDFCVFLCLLMIQGVHMNIWPQSDWYCHCNVLVFFSLPDDSTPQQRENHEENQWSPDDKMIDPSPIMRVESQLQMRHETGKPCVNDASEVWSSLSSLDDWMQMDRINCACWYLECHSEDEHSEDQRPKGPVPEHLLNQVDKQVLVSCNFASFFKKSILS